MKKKLLIFFCLVLLAAASCAAYLAWIEYRRVKSEVLLPKIAEAFKKYANQAKGELYPAADAKLGIADLDEFIDTYAKGDEELRHYLNGGTGVELCYPGYAAFDEMTALGAMYQIAKGGEFIHEVVNHQYGVKIGALEKNGLADYRKGRIYHRNLYQLREGIERFFIYETGNPGSSAKAQSVLPVMWEMPDNQSPPGGWVLYLDGSTNWIPYPSIFPMTQRVIEAARKIKGAVSRSDMKTSPYMLFPPKPMFEISDRGAILNSLNDLTQNLGSYSGYLGGRTPKILLDINFENFPIVELLIASRRINNAENWIVHLLPESESIKNQTMDRFFPVSHEGWEKRHLGKLRGYNLYGHAPLEVLGEIVLCLNMEESEWGVRDFINSGHVRIANQYPQESLVECQDIWLNPDSSDNVQYALYGLLELKTEESAKVIEDGLRPEFPAFKRNLKFLFMASPWKPGSIEKSRADTYHFLKELSLDDRVELTCNRIRYGEYIYVRSMECEFSYLQGEKRDDVKAAFLKYSSQNNVANWILEALAKRPEVLLEEDCPRSLTQWKYFER